MKKIRLLSVLLTVITALSCLSSTAASATETSGFDITEIPESIFYADYEEMLYGVTIQLDDTTVVINEDNLLYAYTQNDAASLGYVNTSGMIYINDNAVWVHAYAYICDKIEVAVSCYYGETDHYYRAEKSLPYPSDYETPNVFCKDGICYKKGSNNTLSVIKYFDSYKYDENENRIYQPIVIPESIDGMTVTEIANTAFSNGSHYTEITIPKSVTSIGKYALGYCLYPYCGDDVHGIPNKINAYILTNEFRDADDSEEFFASISLRSDDNTTYSEYLRETYFADCEDFVYDTEYEKIYVTATKATLLSVTNEPSLYINLIYDNGTKIDYYLYNIMDITPDDELIPITIYTVAETVAQGKKIRTKIINKYFSEDTEIFYDDYNSMYVYADKSQIEALSTDENVTDIKLGDSIFINRSLYNEIYFADDNDTFNIFFEPIYSDSEDFDVHDYYEEVHNRFFKNCESETISSSYYSDLYIIYGATKAQIINAAYDGAIMMNTFNEPNFNKFIDLTVYGEAGSEAEAYANEHGFKFLEVKAEYQPGDANLDGVISVADATLIMKSNVGLEELTDQQLELADYDGNGVVNVMDATELQKMLAGY